MKRRKIVLTIIFIYMFNISYSQENEKNKIQASDGVYRSSLNYVTKISDKLSLENRLIFSYNYDYQLVEIPLNLKYMLNEKLSLFAGPKLNYFRSNNSLVGSSLQEYNFSIQGGVRYNHSQNIFGEVKYEHNLSKNNKTIINPFKKGALKVKLAHQF